MDGLKVVAVVACVLAATGCDSEQDGARRANAETTADAAPPDAAAPAPLGPPPVLLDAAVLDAAMPDAAADADNPLGDLRPVTLRFKAKLGTDDLACDRTYPKQGSSQATVRVQDFRFFVSNVRLLTAAGGEVPLQLDEHEPFQSRDLALIDFTDGQGSCVSGGAQTNTSVTGQVPPGEYTGVAFSTSVPELFNHGDPALAPSPLKAPGAHWSWLAGYRFLLAELVYVSGGIADAGASDAGTSDAGSPSGGGGHHSAQAGLGLVHVGSTGCLGGVSVGFQCANANRNDIRIHGFDLARNVVIADLGALFAKLDLSQDVQCHARGELCASPFAALGIDLGTGAPLATQQVFRAE